MDDNLLNSAINKLAAKNIAAFTYIEIEAFKKALTASFMNIVIADANKLYKKCGAWSDVYIIIGKRYKMRPRLVRDWVKPVKVARALAR